MYDSIIEIKQHNIRSEVLRYRDVVYTC
jgi:hypothetical protein